MPTSQYGSQSTLNPKTRNIPILEQMCRPSDPLHSVQGQSFSNAFSNADGYKRSRLNGGELLSQQFQYIRPQANTDELSNSAWHARSQGKSPPTLSGSGRQVDVTLWRAVPQEMPRLPITPRGARRCPLREIAGSKTDYRVRTFRYCADPSASSSRDTY